MKNIKHYDVVLVEPKCSPGHIMLYKELINGFFHGSKILFISTSEYNCHFKGINVDFISINCKTYKNKISYRFNQFLFIGRLISIIKKVSYNKCFFLSYENISISLFSYFINELHLFEHNNIDQVTSSKLKSLFYSITSIKTIHVTFEDYIGEYIRDTYGKNYMVVDHPHRKISCICSGVSPFNCNYVFCPSSDVSYEFLVKLANYCNEFSLLLVVKKPFDLEKYCDVYHSPYFDDYDEVFMGAKYIAVGVSFSYRVSGVFYEAIANEKKVIMNECLFSNVMKAKYSHAIEVIL